MGFAAMPAAVAQNPDLTVSVSDSPDPANAGDLITYVIDFANNGTGAANDAAVEMIAPANTILVQVQVLSGAGWSASAASNTAQFGKFSAAASETAQFQVKVKIDKGAASGTIINATATTTTSSTDNNLSNNAGTASTTVGTAADLRINLADAPDPVDPGSNVVYTYVVSNFGPSNASNVTVALPVPANTTFVSASTSLGSGWTLTMPGVGGTGNVQFFKGTMVQQEGAIFKTTVRVDDNAGSSISAQVSIAGATPEAAPGDETAAVTTAVNGAAVPCTLKVKRPNGGQVWPVGSKQRVKWESTGICCDFVRIEMWQDGQKVRNIKKITPNDGKAPWRIKASKFSPGANYKVRVLCPGVPGAQDFSNGTFTLVGP